MTILEEDQRLGGEVQRTKRILLKLLKPEERKTTRVVGSEYSQTFEDKARAICESGDFRAFEVKLALDDFQGSVNTFWEAALEQEIPDQIVKRWIENFQPKFAEHGGTFEDAVSEATFKLRYMIIRYKPAKATLHTYSRWAITRELTLWLARLGAPVEMPEKQAKSGEGPSRADYDDYLETVGERPKEDVYGDSNSDSCD